MQPGTMDPVTDDDGFFFCAFKADFATELIARRICLARSESRRAMMAHSR